jgi:hypothetical protein
MARSLTAEALLILAGHGRAGQTAALGGEVRARPHWQRLERRAAWVRGS